MLPQEPAMAGLSFFFFEELSFLNAEEMRSIRSKYIREGEIVGSLCPALFFLSYTRVSI